MSYTNLVYHIVFRTYRSIPAIEEAHEREFYAYAYGYTTRHRAKLYRIGGMPDHVHILVSLPPDLAVSEFVRGLKYATNGWMKHNPLFPLFAGWGEGYAAFTYSKEQIPVVKQYIINQKEHHRQTSFAEEYRKIILDGGGEIDDKYFLKDWRSGIAVGDREEKWPYPRQEGSPRYASEAFWAGLLKGHPPGNHSGCVALGFAEDRHHIHLRRKILY